MLLGFVFFGFFVGCLQSADPITGNEQLGIAYDLNYYGTAEGLLLKNPAAFNNPNTNGEECVGMAVSSDIRCSSIGNGMASGSHVTTSESQTSSWNEQSGVGLNFSGFSSSVSSSYSSSYYYSQSYAVTMEYGDYITYELVMDWKTRGLTSDFKKDINSGTSTCSLCDKYGYFFLVSGYYGGNYMYSQSASYLTQNSSSSMETSISASFEAFSSSTNFGNQHSGTSSQSESEYTFTYTGCNYQCLAKGASCTWVDSCNSNPQLFSFDDPEKAPSLLSITDVFSAFGYSTRESESTSCVSSYLKSLPSQPFTKLKLGSLSQTLESGSQGGAGLSAPLSCNCTYQGDNLVITGVTVTAFNTAPEHNSNEQGGAISSLQCTYSALAETTTGVQGNYYQVSDFTGNSGSFVASTSAPPGAAFVGWQWLGESSDCDHTYGIRLYWQYVDFQHTKAPFIGSLNSNQYSDLRWVTGYSTSTCHSLTAGPSNSAMAAIYAGGYQVQTDGHGDEVEDYNSWKADFYSFGSFSA